MDRRVDDGLRRLALKKLFGDPRLNAADGLDVFSEDYSKLEDLPQEMVAKLEHMRRTLRRPEPEQEEGEGSGAGTAAWRKKSKPNEEVHEQEDENDGDEPKDVARRQDT